MAHAPRYFRGKFNHEQTSRIYPSKPMFPSRSPSATHSFESSAVGRPAKRRRLNLACNYCRSRKTRCDEQKPSCHACLAASLPCITTDRRRPGQQIERHEAGRQRSSLQLDSRLKDAIQDIRPQAQHEAGNGFMATLSPYTTSTVLPNRAESERFPIIDDEVEDGRVDSTASNGDGSRFHGRLPILKHSTHSSMVEILTGWLNMAFFRLALKQRFVYRPPGDADRIQNPLFVHVPRIPDQAQTRTLLDKYFQQVNAVYPILEEEETSKFLSAVHIHGVELIISQAGQLPPLATLLLALDLGSTKGLSTGTPSPDTRTFCRDMLGRLVERPTIHAVQAMFLLSLSFYRHDDLLPAWAILSLCISTATTIGLNKPSAPTSSSEEPRRRRIWWSLFCFDIFLAFELGRQATLSDQDNLQADSTLASSSYSMEQHSSEASKFQNDRSIGHGWEQQQKEGVNFFETVINLAKLLNKIGRRCIEVRDREDLTNREGLERVISEKVRITGEACLMLTRWAEKLPDKIRPGSDLIYDTTTFPQAAFISIHYYNALQVLTRNSLLISESALRASTNTIARGKPWGNVIRHGQTLAANNARRSVTLFIEAEELGTPLLMPNAGATLHALYILAVHLVRHPKNRMAESDMHLIDHAADFTKQHPAFSSQARLNDLNNILHQLRSVIKQNLNSPLPAFTSGRATPQWELNQNYVQAAEPGEVSSPSCTPMPLYSSESLLATREARTNYDDYHATERSNTMATPILIHEGLRVLENPSHGDVLDSTFDASCYQGMDMGTWSGLDEVGWNWNQMEHVDLHSD